MGSGQIALVGTDRLPLTRRSRHRSGRFSSYSLLKKGIWAYFLLLLLEGALRKWFLPGLATPLLIIRDPLALWLVLACWYKGLLPSNAYMLGLVLIGFLSLYTGFFLGHGNFFVALYGARVLFLNIPLIFVIGSLFDRNDVIALGRVTVAISIPMALLIAVQFYSPQTAWVNRGVGGDLEGAGFGGALGYFRPPGTFSFTNGTSLFFSFAACFIFYFWLNLKYVNRVVLFLATVGLFAAIPLSISRGLFFQVITTILFAVIAISHKPKYIGRMLVAGICGILLIALLSKSNYFSTSVEAFTARFEHANEVEGGLKGVLGDRFLGGMLSALTQSSREPFFGYGIGLGTNVGLMLMPDMEVTLNLDQEWARLVSELGPLLGVALVLMRLGLSISLAMKSYHRLIRGDMLPWMLLSFGFLTIAQAQWAQPTSLGFCTIIGGLLIASFRIPKKKVRTTPQKLFNF